ncbi:MAG TPA: MmpS family transport accessory protein [Niabella sp.]|nr:MmpS family transport accessory protein [Niabella sp.]
MFLATSCKKSGSDIGNNYPKQVNITYRVSSTATNSLVSITYDNETGGQTTVNNPSLPFTITITKTVNKNNIITLGYFVNPDQTVKLEILVNNEVVKSQTYSNPNSAMSYTFQ